jgi:hypothetical protein
MAHDIAGSTLQIHQALHGYSRGHQRLSGSPQVRPRDAKMMLVLSDISGPGVRPGDDGYLTGYPLSESGLYVLARTWAAPEMPRPGCVWTHSLLIDFADLAALPDPVVLLDLFRRPEADNFSHFDDVLALEARQIPRKIESKSIEFARRLASGLYDKAKNRIVSARPPDADCDQVVMALWAQQWPRLRRGFRFCTLAGTERTTDGSFDLQLLGDERGTRSRFGDAIDISSLVPTPAAWLDDAIADLMAPDSRGLRTFMRSTGGDIDAGREAFAPLCRLHVLTRVFGVQPHAIGESVRLIDELLGPANAGTARALVATEAIKQPSLDDAGLDFVLASIELADEIAVSEHAGQLGGQVWRRDPARLLAMLGGSDREKYIVEATLSALTAEALFSGAARSQELAPLVLARRPELVVAPGFWSHLPAAADAGFEVLSRRSDILPAAIGAVMEAGREDLVAKTISRLGASAVLRVLAGRWETQDPGTNRRWLKVACRDLGAVAEFFSTGPSLPVEMLVAFSRFTSPDALPNDYGNDAWLDVLASSPQASESMDSYLAAYLLSRALGWRSRNPAELVSFGFDAAYGALSLDQLPGDAWRLLEDRLPWVLPFLSWDQCLRVRNAVADLFVERSLPPSVFVRTTRNDTYFAHLVYAMARTYRGRDYLARVRPELETESAENGPARKRLVESLIDRR